MGLMDQKEVSLALGEENSKGHLGELVVVGGTVAEQLARLALGVVVAYRRQGIHQVLEVALLEA
jgi:predicted 2-oxoglutarate/Fe(II)-dependent dioxygenase YbiX